MAWDFNGWHRHSATGTDASLVTGDVGAGSNFTRTIEGTGLQRFTHRFVNVGPCPTASRVLHGIPDPAIEFNAQFSQLRPLLNPEQFRRLPIRQVGVHVDAREVLVLAWVHRTEASRVTGGNAEHSYASLRATYGFLLNTNVCAA